MEIGRVLNGRYEIVERIGSGGMSTVYRAHEIGLERAVAVKVLITALSNDPQLVERFKREAKTIASLQHNSIIPIYYYGVEADFGSYLVMPLLKGGTLDQRLKQLTIRPSLTEVGELASQLGSALQYAHDRGVVHRDIKFSNIMFDDAGSPYLMDFGIAKMLGATNLTGTGMTVGTPQFMPPEQWRNDEITPAVDQYALAVLLYAMLTQRMPFDAPTPHALMYQHLQEAPPLARQFREDVPQAIENALTKALSKDPQGRFASVATFTEQIAEASRSATREYSGFFKAPIDLHIGQTGIRTTVDKGLANTSTHPMPSTAIASGAAQQATHTPAAVDDSTVARDNTPQGSSAAFIGGLLTVLLVGLAGLLGFLYLQNNSDVPMTPSAVVEQAEQTATLASGIVALEATATATTHSTVVQTASPTKTVVTASQTPTVPSTASPTSLPDFTATALADFATAQALSQMTQDAEIARTSTALAQLVTQQAMDNRTATQETRNNIATAEANLNAGNTATVVANNQAATQAMIVASNTALADQQTEQAQLAIDVQASEDAFSQQVTATAQQNYRHGTMTAIAISQDSLQTQRAQMQATATARAIVTATETPLPVIQVLPIGEAQAVTVRGERSQRWSFEARSGMQLTISVRSADFDTVIDLYDADSHLLQSDDDGGYRLNSRITNYNIIRSGMYHVVVRTFNNTRLTGTYTIGITERVQCPRLPVSRMLVGDWAQVTFIGGANRIRRDPSTNQQEIGRIPPGGVVEVLAGPECGDGFIWYQVDYNGIQGWTAEGDQQHYYIELLPADDRPVLLINGEGLTNGARLGAGEFQVEYYCRDQGLRASNDGENWYCLNNSNVRTMTLDHDDFNQICRDTYSIETAIAIQTEGRSQEAYRWRCFYYPE